MAQPTKPGNADRGWNDPPMFLHSPGMGKPAPGGAKPHTKRAPLTKRVAAFPGMYGGGVTNQAPPSSNSTIPPTAGNPPPPLSAPKNSANITQIKPPPPVNSTPAMPVPPSVNQVILLPPASSTELPKFTAPIIVPSMSPQDSAPIATNPVNHKPVSMGTSHSGDESVSIPDFDDDDQLYHFVITRLYRVLNDCKTALEEKASQEVSRKLEILSSMWKDGKISYPVKSAMAQLATALHTRKCDLANDLHLGLMMDYVSEVGQWMVGIKRLIHEARNVEPPCSPTDCTASQTVLDATAAGTDSISATDDDAASQTSASDNTGSHGNSRESSPMNGNVPSDLSDVPNDPSHISVGNNANPS